MAAMVAATAAKTIGNEIQIGRPRAENPPTQMRPLPVPPIVTRNTADRKTRAPSHMGAHRNQFDRPTARNPIPMPRNEPRSTKFEKNERYAMCAPSHRIRTSSTNSIRKLARNRRRRSAETVLPSTCAPPDGLRHVRVSEAGTPFCAFDTSAGSLEGEVLPERTYLEHGPGFPGV